MTIEGGFDADINRLNKKLDRLNYEIRNPLEPHREASIALYGKVLRTFDKQNAEFGGWKPLAPRTVIEKARIGKEVPLVRSGHLRQGFVPFFSKDNAGVRNAVTYAQAHQEGTGRIPARNMLLSREAVLNIGIKIYTRWVQKQVAVANA